MTTAAATETSKQTRIALDCLCEMGRCCVRCNALDLAVHRTAGRGVSFGLYISKETGTKGPITFSRQWDHCPWGTILRKITQRCAVGVSVKVDKEIDD